MSNLFCTTTYTRERTQFSHPPPSYKLNGLVYKRGLYRYALRRQAPQQLFLIAPLEEVKAKSEFENLPIVMLTSRSNEKHRKLAANLGASAYLSKPYNEQHLLHTLAQLID